MDLDDVDLDLPAVLPHARLVELVVHLSDAPAAEAARAIGRAASAGPPLDGDDRLAIVAEALVALRAIDLRDRAEAPAPARPDALV